MDFTKLLAFSLFSSLLLSAFPNAPVTQLTLQKGPRSPYLDLIYYTTPSNCYTALKNGDIDIMGWPITDSLCIEEIMQHPSWGILLAPIQDSFEMRGFNFNINQSIATYGHRVNSTMKEDAFRKALAYLIDKNWIVSNIFGGYADRIDVPFPKSQQSWWNTSVTGLNYPYE